MPAHSFLPSKDRHLICRFFPVPTLLLRSLALLVLVVLGGCAGRPGPDVLEPPSVATTVAGAKVVTVYVATTRGRAAGSSLDRGFTSERSYELNYAEYKISVPPTHQVGEIEWPTSTVRDPRKSFVTIGYRRLDKASFEHAVTLRDGKKPHEVGIFVHGFNNNFQEALFRTVQIGVDAGGGTTAVLFAWPSEASIGGYVADKDAVTFSRDQLAGLIQMVGSNSNVTRTTVLGHSMGGWLTVEALRQLRLMGKDAVLGRVKVILAAPDIDVDVFRAQLQVIGPMSSPMTILVSKDDRALAVSSFISGERGRVGALDVDDPRVEEAARAADVQVVDISGLSARDTFKHNRFSELSVYFPVLAKRDETGSAPDLRKAGAFVFNAVGATIASPFSLAGKLVSGR